MKELLVQGGHSNVFFFNYYSLHSPIFSQTGWNSKTRSKNVKQIKKNKKEFKLNK